MDQLDNMSHMQADEYGFIPFRTIKICLIGKYYCIQ